MPNNQTRDKLVEELEIDGNQYFGSGKMNNITDLALTICTVLASLVSTVLATVEVPRWVLATVAAVPAAAASLQRIGGIRERSNWYFTYAAHVRSLATKLKFANAPNVEEFAQKRAELEIEMEEAWSKVGHSGMVASSRGNRRPPSARANQGGH